MPKKFKELKFPLMIQRDEHGQYYVQKTFNDNIEMEEWLQKFTNQRLQINNLQRDLQRANEEIEKLKPYKELYNNVFNERVKETSRANNAEKVTEQIIDCFKTAFSKDYPIVVNYILKQVEDIKNGTFNS